MSEWDCVRVLRGEVVVDASLRQVWEAWTTAQGVKSFFAPDCNIELRPDGMYEILFDPDAEPGQRGAEGMRVLALQPFRMLSFTWNAPPSLPEVRDQRTHVQLRFHAIGTNRTKVTLLQDGWGEGGQWDEAFEYFDRAWNRIVLPRLSFRFTHGPADWKNPPDLG